MSDSLTKNTIEHSASYLRRFGGIAKLYGDTGLAKLSQAHVCVIGIGGVGSWVVESIARSGVGKITMIDMDMVSESNINRQILATTDTIGRDKIAAMDERISGINPECQVTLVDEFINKENTADLIHDDFDYVIDCIDDYRKKAALIAHCKRQKIRVLTVGGAGGQTDPSKIRQTDLTNTEHDKLLSTTRKLLRQDYGFARNPKRTFGIPCVFSDEQSLYPDGQGGLSYEKPFETLEKHKKEANESDMNSKNVENDDISSGLSCAGGIGSITHVTASFAFYATSFVLRKLASAE